MANRWTIRSVVRRATYPVSVCGGLALFLACFCAAKNRPAPVNLFPRLQAGQTLSYQISYHSDKHIKTQSSVIVATPADSAKIDVNVLLRLEILGVRAQGTRAVIRARTRFEVLDSDSHFKAPEFDPPSPE